MRGKRVSGSFLRNILPSLRKTVKSLRKCADFMGSRLDSAKDDTCGIIDLTIDKTQAITRRIELGNFIKILTLLTVILTFITLFISANNMAEVIFFTNGFDLSVILVSFGLMFLNIFYFAWQALLASTYKPFAQIPYEKLPVCTVIVPAYNEGKGICRALQSVLDSDYPREKLEIIAINDGSRDDTWYWMKKTADESNGRIIAIDLGSNYGKRHALHRGFKEAKGSVAVTIDSDSVVLKDTLREMVAPFAHDKKIGAVAGNIRVLNFKDAIIPKMLDVSFVFSFDFIRAAQSVLRSVLCTPGALSAYRMEIVKPVVDEWREQLFWGRPANIGDDRAMTNLILREGYEVVFQKSAVVYTEVPDNYKGLCKMLIRWARSNIRENMVMFGFAFKRFDLEDENLLGMQLNLLMHSLWTLTPVLFLSTTLYCLFVDPWTFVYSALTVIVVWSTFPAFVYASRCDKNEALWSYVYGVFNFLALTWIGPYSVLTIHKTGWLTREKPKETSAPKLAGEKAKAVAPIGRSPRRSSAS